MRAADRARGRACSAGTCSTRSLPTRSMSSSSATARIEGVLATRVRAWRAGPRPRRSRPRGTGPALLATEDLIAVASSRSGRHRARGPRVQAGWRVRSRVLTGCGRYLRYGRDDRRSASERPTMISTEPPRAARPSISSPGLDGRQSTVSDRPLSGGTSGTHRGPFGVLGALGRTANIAQVDPDAGRSAAWPCACSTTASARVEHQLGRRPHRAPAPAGSRPVSWVRATSSMGSRNGADLVRAADLVGDHRRFGPLGAGVQAPDGTCETNRVTDVSRAVD